MLRPPGLVQYFRTSHHWFPSILRYGSVGGFVLCIDLATYALFLRFGIEALTAGALAGLIAAFVHFFATKYFSFQNRQNAIGRQAIVYSCLGAMWWILTLGIIGFGTRVFHMNPIAAKLLAVAINFPLGFLAHKTLTFGRGLDDLTAFVARRSQAKEPGPSL